MSPEIFLQFFFVSLLRCGPADDFSVSVRRPLHTAGQPSYLHLVNSTLSPLTVT